MKSKKKVDKKVRLVYLYYQSIFEKYLPANKIMPITTATGLLGLYRIPKQFRYAIIKEMVEMELLRMRSAYELELVNTSSNKVLLDCSKVYRMLGLF